MKKIIITMSLIFSLGLVGCGQKTEVKQTNTNEVKQETKAEIKNEFKFPEGQSKVGKGTIYISTPSGTSENGSVPVLMVEKDTSITQIGLNASNFDGSKVSYIYVNKKFVQKEQLGEMTQSSLNLEGDLLKDGTYTVSVVQYENDDINGKVTQFIETKYEVKGL